MTTKKQTTAAGAKPRKRRTDGVTPAQEKFCQAYALEPNGAAAYAQAYPGSQKWKPQTRAEEASRLLATPKIRTRLEALQAEITAAAEKRYGVTVERIVGELARIAFADAGDYFDWGPQGVTIRPKSELMPDQRRVVSEASQTISAEGGTIRVKLHDKLTAIDKLMRYFGMLKERHEHTGRDGKPIELQLCDFERARRLAFLLTSAAEQAPQQAAPSQVNGAAPADDRPQLVPPGGFRKTPTS